MPVFHGHAAVGVHRLERLVGTVQPDIVPTPVFFFIHKIGVVQNERPGTVCGAEVSIFKSLGKKEDPFRGLAIAGFFFFTKAFENRDLTGLTRKRMLQGKAVVPTVHPERLRGFFHDECVSRFL